MWQLNISLTQYTPAEAQQMTGLSTAMQRDWRHRGFGSRVGKQARFSIFDVAEMYFMKAASDQGKGPSLSAPYASRVSERLVATGLMWRDDMWAGDRPVEMFERIPRGARSFTPNEQYCFETGYGPEEESEDAFKRQWGVIQLFHAMSLAPQLRWGGQAIWWPTGEFEIGSYEESRFSGLGTVGKLSKVDPKFDGPALVYDLEPAAEILADRAPREWLTAELILHAGAVAPEIKKRRAPINLGKVLVTAGDKRAVYDPVQLLGGRNA